MGKKGGKKPKQAGQDDDDALLEAYVKAGEQKQVVEVKHDVEVTPRANASFLGDAQGRLWLFGGECFHGEDTTTYDDLFVHENGRWSRVSSSAGPKGRNGHQGVIVGESMFIFGGEFSIDDGYDVKHLGDLWRFDLKTHKWREVTGKSNFKLPSCRSGHRMAVLDDSKGVFALFGGYHDTGRGKPRKFNELFIFTAGTENNVTCVSPTVKGSKPEPRSGHCLGCLPNGMLCVYGGTNNMGRPMKDMWAIDVDGTATWREIEFNAASLRPRIGMSMALVNGTPYFFGGLSEEPNPDPSKKKKVKTMYNDLWMLDIKEQRFVPVKAKGGPPQPRMSSAMASVGGHLVMYGGIMEVDKGQVTLGDLWHAKLSDDTAEWQQGKGGEAVMGCDGEESDEEGEETESVSSGVDDAQSDDELPYGYGIDEPLRVPPRLAQFSKGSVAQFNAWHYPMMNDVDRNTFYMKGLKEGLAKFKNGMVLDVGSGAGLLSLIAAKLGARKVVGCECRGELAGVANELAARNGVGDVVTVVPKVSTALTPKDLGSEPDIIVHELFGALLFGERCVKFISDARKRLGAKHCVPRRGVQYATLISSPTLRQMTSMGDGGVADLGLDLGYANVLQDTCNLFFTKAQGIDMGSVPFTRLTERIAIAEVDFMATDPEAIPRETSYTAQTVAAGEVTAVLFTWEAFNDGSDQALSTEPGVGGAVRSSAWGQAFQVVEKVTAGSPLPQPLEVTKGATVELHVRFAKDLSTLQCDVVAE